MHLYGLTRNSRQIQDIVVREMQKTGLRTYSLHLDVVGEKQRYHIDDIREVIDKKTRIKVSQSLNL